MQHTNTSARYPLVAGTGLFVCGGVPRGAVWRCAAEFATVRVSRLAFMWFRTGGRKSKRESYVAELSVGYKSEIYREF